MTNIPIDAHEWVTFEDPKRKHEFRFDVSFLESNWTCIFGNGCQGVLTEDATDLVQGCCSYGAHFVDEKDAKRVEKAAKRLTDDQWQFKAKGAKGTTRTKKNGEITTRLVEDACIFLNRPGFKRGPGCALHVLAMDTGESYIPLKPDVCWQVPLRRDEETRDDGYLVTSIRQWDRRDWGGGGEEFHWWCTESPDAFVGRTRVVDSMKEELVAMIGQPTYDRLLAYLDSRAQQPKGVRLPHPAVRSKA